MQVQAAKEYLDGQPRVCCHPSFSTCVSITHASCMSIINHDELLSFYKRVALVTIGNGASCMWLYMSCAAVVAGNAGEWAYGLASGLHGTSHLL